MRLRQWLMDRIIGFICTYIQAGAHCGCCGKWVPHELVPTYWAWTICDNCSKEDTQCQP